MSITLWAFKDANGTVRVTANDPTAALVGAGMKKSSGSAPGGFSMRDLRRFFETSEQMLSGQSGAEGFLEFTLEDLSSSDFLNLMGISEG